MRTLLPAAMLVAACSMAPLPSLPPGTGSYLTPTEHLARASLALRGVRPSLDELRAVAADPDRLPGLVDRYLASPEFGTTIRELHQAVLLLHPQLPNFTPPPAPPLADIPFSAMNGSIYDEPLRLIEDIVMSDQPYTRIVTADYTMADRTVATVWGLGHSDDSGWERTAWTDDRGAAGILASTALYLRYRSVAANYNRARANAVSRSLLCHDFSESDIHIDTSVNLSDPTVVADAVVNNPSCAGCHQAMDPLASYFTPFLQGTMNSVVIPSYPVEFYRAEDVSAWQTTTHRPPGYFGTQPSGLAGLGQAIAADPRFARCTAVHFAGYLTERPERDLAPAWIAQLQDGFVQSGFSAKQLARAIVLSDEFRTASAPDPVAAEGVIGYQKVRPQQLAHMLQRLTGYVWQTDTTDTIAGWTFGHVDFLDDDYLGFRTLAGGLDGYYVTEPTHTMSATASLVSRTVARQAAAFVVDHDDAAAPADRWLFSRAVTDTDPAGVRTQLAELHGRIYSELVAPDDPALDDTEALFDGALAASGDPRRAWTVTLAGMLGDLRAVYY
ncbi:MAG: DUF1585 domain-containing protein [Deltaproteobacteria bacterium]|nr:MAG: DUF1585 domain-containing protein [Deltaproteobacteria bacterium]TMQ14595.1 MAG: DUF1585 domain-containing protein [Deltaproteobacteria bacterium]